MRNVGLDLLRILAVLLVIGRHLPVSGHSSEFLQTWMRGGWVGVDLFFVLSGFLVSSLIFREYLRDGAFDAKRFLVRRAFKIYPAFWLLLLTTLVARRLGGESISLRGLCGEVFFVQNYLGGLWAHTWSLAVEEHFYIGLSVLVVGLLRTARREPFRVIPQVFAVIAVSCLSLRLLTLALSPQFTPRAYLFGTHVRIDSLMFGVLLSYFWNFRSIRERIAPVPTAVMVGVGVALLAPAFIFPVEDFRWVSVVGVVEFYLGSGCLLLAALRLEETRILPLRGLAALGAASYSIYLWHIPVASWGSEVIRRATGAQGELVYVLNAIFGACAFGWVLSRAIECPVLMLRDRLFPSRSGALERQHLVPSRRRPQSDRKFALSARVEQAGG